MRACNDTEQELWDLCAAPCHATRRCRHANVVQDIDFGSEKLHHILNHTRNLLLHVLCMTCSLTLNVTISSMKSLRSPRGRVPCLHGDASEPLPKHVRNGAWGLTCWRNQLPSMTSSRIAARRR